MKPANTVPATIFPMRFQLVIVYVPFALNASQAVAHGDDLLCPPSGLSEARSFLSAVSEVQSRRERKPFGTRRARIKQQRLAEPFNFLPMRMTKDAEVWLFFLEERSSFFHQLPAFIQNMTDGDEAAGQFDHGPIANVPGVENVIDAFKMSSNRRIE